MSFTKVRDSVFQGLVIVLGMLSLTMIIHGVWHQTWWAGLSLVLFVTSFLCWISIFWGAKKTLPL